MEIVNRTPYIVERAVLADKTGAETLILAVKATYDLSAGEISLSEEQEPIVLADEYRGEPGKSSLLRAAEMLLSKSATDVLLTGHAIAPRKGISRMAVAVRVGPLIQQCIVSGNRPTFKQLSRPEPFDRIALTWENAFGGVDQSPSKEADWDYQAENPVGKGFLARKTCRKIDEIPLPNIEHPKHPLRAPGDRPPPVGFGPIAPAWMPRLNYAGTYDDEWLHNRAPLLPEDFDHQFFQTAPRPLVAKGYLKGNEECLLQGVTPEGILRFRLASMPPVLHVRLVKGGVQSRPNLETIHIDSDRGKIYLLWKSAINLHGRLELLREIEACLG